MSLKVNKKLYMQDCDNDTHGVFFSPAPLVWSVCGPLSDTGPFLSVNLAPGDVQSLTKPHRGRSNVQWTGRYT